MGMYDLVKINKKFLPKQIENQEIEWQTKSSSKFLLTLIINEDGSLYEGYELEHLSYDKPDFDFKNHTGVITFYSTIGEEWWEFDTFFEKGFMKKIIQTKPDTDYILEV